MATTLMGDVIQHLRQTVRLRDGAGLSDGQLLGDYVSRRDEAALEALVQRHGPMVWSVCRRILGNPHDAEDAFQATFLVFVRKAASIASRELLANWLYGVAYQTARKARATAARRQARERQVTQMPEPALEQETWDDLQALLDHELSKLADKYRTVLVLCDLEGKTRKEAARQLRCPEGTVASRLATARTMLAKRLARHGLAVTGEALALALAQSEAAAGVPPAVVSSTVKAANLFAAGQVAAVGVISPTVVALTQGVLKAMLMSKLKAVVAVVLLLGFIGTGAIVLSGGVAAQNATPAPSLAEERAKPPHAKPKTDNDKLQGTWRVFEMITDGKPNVKEHPDDEADAIFTGDKLVLVAQPAGKKFLEFTNKLDATKKPKAIDLTITGGTGKGKVAHGIYELDGDTLKLCLPQDVDAARPTEFTSIEGARHVLFTMRRQKPPQKQEEEKGKGKEKEKECFTAWGKEVGGLQAGLGYPPGQKQVYHTGEAVRLVVRVRNVGKEAVKFQYLRQFLIENPPVVTYPQGELVRLPGINAGGLAHVPEQVNLAPGKEIELYELKLALRPESDASATTPSTFPGWLSALYGTGKFQIHYERVFGNSSAGQIKLDPTLSKLATGKLELEVKSDPPPATEKKTRLADKQAEKPKEALLPRGPYTTVPIGPESIPQPVHPPVEQPAWGKPLNGLRLGLYQTDSNGDGMPRLTVVLDNVGTEDLVLILGQSWARGKKHQLGAMGLKLTTAEGMLKRSYDLRPKGSKRDDLADGAAAGPFVVQLVAGGRYTISSDLHDYYDPKDVDALLAPGKYRVAAKFVGQAYLKSKTDTGPRTWAEIMTYWTGTVESGVIQVTLTAKQAK